MDVLHMLHTLVRRWYVVLPLVIVTGALASSATERINPTYTASATGLVVSVTPVRPGPQVASINPAGVAQILTVAASSRESREKIASAGLLPTYKLTTRPRTAIVDVSVEGSDAGQVVRTVQAVLERVPRQFAERPEIYGGQGGTRPDLEVLAAPALAEAAYTGRTRVLAVIVALGAAVTVLSAYLADTISQRLGSRRRQRLPRPDSADLPAGSADSDETAALEDHNRDPVSARRAEVQADGCSSAASGHPTPVSAVPEPASGAHLAPGTNAHATEPARRSTGWPMAPDGGRRGVRPQTEAHGDPADRD